MLKTITKGTDPIHVDRLSVCIYGPPGIGKTTLAFTAAKPILLDFDKGVHRAANRGDAVRVTKWDDIAGMVAADLDGYETVIVDTAGRALDMLALSIIAKDPKLGRAGSLSLQGYGALKSAFTGWMNLLNSLGKDVVLITHMDESRKGDEIIERIDVQGGSKGEIYKSADAMGRLSMLNGQRILTFSPSDTAFGKNPGQLEATAVPSPVTTPNFLATIIQQIKDKLNEQTAEQAKASSEVESFRLAFTALETPEEFDAMRETLPAGASKVVKSLLVSTAKAKGFTFDKASSKFQPAGGAQ